jgi:hypothetical protein
MQASTRRLPSCLMLALHPLLILLNLSVLPVRHSTVTYSGRRLLDLPVPIISIRSTSNKSLLWVMQRRKIQPCCVSCATRTAYRPVWAVTTSATAPRRAKNSIGHFTNYSARAKKPINTVMYPEAFVASGLGATTLHHALCGSCLSILQMVPVPLRTWYTIPTKTPDCSTKRMA